MVNNQFKKRVIIEFVLNNLLVVFEAEFDLFTKKEDPNEVEDEEAGSCERHN